MSTTPHDALLEHRTFLLRLARSLVRDESTAEDLVQDASAAYLASPPLHQESSRAWLARVVRRLAGKDHRSKSRIRAREAAVARPEWDPSQITETDRQLDAQSTLIALLKDLPEKQRQVVKLRYHDDLNPKAIAQLLGLDVSTVHTRLHRALGTLRESMDRRTEGGRELWAAAILPTATQVAGKGALSVALTHRFVALPMAAVASVAVLAAAYVALSPRAEPTPSNAAAAPAAEPSQPQIALAGVAPTATGAHGTRRSTVASTAATEDPGNWLIPVTATGDGVTKKPTRLHIAGVMEGFNWGAERELEITMNAPGNGVIDLRELLGARAFQLSKPITGLVIRVEHPDCPSLPLTFPISPITDLEVAPAGPTSIAFDLPLSSVVTGHVTLAQPTAASSARVFAFPMGEAGSTNASESSSAPLPVSHVGKDIIDSDGNYRLRMTHDGPIAVVIIANGHRPETRVVSVDRGESHALDDVTLGLGQLAQGTLTWMGEPVPAGTRLFVDTVGGNHQWTTGFDDQLEYLRLSWESGRFELGSAPVRTDAHGRFTASGLGERPIQVTLNDLRPFGSFSPTVLADSVSLPADLTLELGAATLEVRFDFGDASPVNGTLQGTIDTGSDTDSTQHMFLHVTQGAPVQLAVPPGAEVELVASFEGHGPSVVRHAAPALAGQTLVAVVPVLPQGSLGRFEALLSIDGEPLEDGTLVQLELLPQGTRDWSKWVTQSTQVSAGKATFSELPLGRFDATLYPGRTAQWPSTFRVAAHVQVEFEAQGSVEVSRELAPGGRVLMAARTGDGRLVAMQFHARILNEAGDPVPCDFRTRPPGENSTYGGWTAHAPAGTLSNLPVGSYTLELRHPEFAPVDQVFRIESDSETRVDVELKVAD